MESHYAHRIWYDPDRLNQLLTVKTDKYGGMPRSTLTRKVQGFVTGTKSRNLLFQLLEQIVNEDIDLLNTENLVNELLTLIRKPGSNKIEAAPGKHDDTVMAYLIGMYVLLNATNLSDYGIRKWERDFTEEDTAKHKETEKEYRDRVRSALPFIDPKYQALFQDFLNQRDPIRDTREFAKRQQQYQFDMENQARTMFRRFTDDDVDQFDSAGTTFSPIRRLDGSDKGIMDLEPEPAQFEDEQFLADSFTPDERASFEQDIFGSNFHRPDTTFNPGDWV